MAKLEDSSVAWRSHLNLIKLLEEVLEECCVVAIFSDKIGEN